MGKAQRTVTIEDVRALARQLPTEQQTLLVDALATELGLPGRVVEIDVTLIDKNPRNPRKAFDKARLRRLGDSMARFGQRSPVQVIPHPDTPGQYLLVDGERRWQAAKDRGITRLRAVVESFDESEALLAMILSHGDRDPLNPIEEAVCISELAKPKSEGGHGMDLAEAGSLFGLRDRTSAQNKVRLLLLPKWLQARVAELCIPESAAREAITPLENCRSDSDKGFVTAYRKRCETIYAHPDSAPSRNEFLEDLRQFRDRWNGTTELAPRLVVDLEETTVHLDGHRFEVSDNAALLLDAAIAAKGKWVNGKERGIPRPDRAFASLPDEIKAACACKRGKGIRVQAPYL